MCCRHTLIKKLSQLRHSEPDLAQLLVDQVSHQEELRHCSVSTKTLF